MPIIRFFGYIFLKIENLISRVKMKYVLSSFAKQGENCHIEKDSSFTSENIVLGSNVFIGDRAKFLSTNAKIIIGNNVMIGPNVAIVTGNHRFDVIGKYMCEVKEKKDSDDQDVIIEDDVWIGMGVLILKGVTIGEGSVIGAGTIVTKDIPKYSIVYNDRNLVIKNRFSETDLSLHKAILKDKGNGSERN